MKKQKHNVGRQARRDKQNEINSTATTNSYFISFYVHGWPQEGRLAAHIHSSME